MVLKYRVPNTKDLELGRFHYYIQRQQQFITFRKYALIALNKYLDGQPEILLQMDIATPRQYVNHTSAYLCLTSQDQEIINRIQAQAELENTSIHIIFKNAILASIEFTENKIWISPILYSKKPTRGCVRPRPIYRETSNIPSNDLSIPTYRENITEEIKAAGPSSISTTAALATPEITSTKKPTPQRNPFITQFNRSFE